MSFPRKASRTRLANLFIGLLAALLIGLLFNFSAHEFQQKNAIASKAETYDTKAFAVDTSPPPKEVAFLGDSFTVGTGASSKADRWTTLVSRKNHWVELNYGFGGTNYGTAGTLSGGKPYYDRLTDLIISRPDVVIVSSAGNTLNYDQEEGIERTFEDLRDALPDSRIIATSPYHRSGPLPDSVVQFGDNVKNGVESVDGEYVNIGHPLEDHPNAMAPDGVHPNDLGYQIIAEAVSKELNL